MKYAISLSSYFHYSNIPKLEDIITNIRAQGYGIELWRELWAENRDLYEVSGRNPLRKLLEGMEVSVHGTQCKSLDEHKYQIEAASELGAKILVIHRFELCRDDGVTPNTSLIDQILQISSSCGLQIAVENLISNTELANMIEFLKVSPLLGVCFDISHVYFTPTPLKSYLDSLDKRIVHVHLQDIRSEGESSIPLADRNNYVPGTGAIPITDWMMFKTRLNDLGYSGMAVFEIQPRNPRKCPKFS